MAPAMTPAQPRRDPVEGPRTEWKERLPRPDRLARTLAAFANGGGGTLFVGIRDDGSISGVPDPAAVRAELLRVAATGVEPAVRLAVRVLLRAELSVVEARVAAPAELPVRAILADGRRVAYVRDGAASRPASGEEERRLGAPGANGSRRGLAANERRALAAIAAGGALRLSELARCLRTGQRTARRLAVALMERGLVLQRADGRYWATPQSHR